MLSGHPHIFTYIFYVIIVYIICYPGHPHMFTYVYIYTILSGHPHIHTHIYIYTLNPTTLPLNHHSSNSRLLLLLLAAATPLKRWRRCRPQQTFQFVIYIYIYQVYHLNGIYKIGGKYSHNIFEIYIPDLSYLDWW